MQNEPLVVDGGGVVEVGSLLVVADDVVDEEVSELVVELVVIDVSETEGAGQERSGRSSCRLNLEEVAPQPARALPGCLFPMEEVLVFVRVTKWEDMILTGNHD